jgi:hypothetical protein
LLRAQLANEPDNTYNWAHLGEVLENIGEAAESEAAFERAVDSARQSGASPGSVSFAELIRVRQTRGAEVSELLDEAVARYPDNLALAWLKVIAEIKTGQPERALRRLERFDIYPDMPAEDTTAYPLELFSSAAPEARGVCLFRLGRYREAAAAFADAERFEPSEPSHRLRRVVAEQRVALASAVAPTQDVATRWQSRELLRGITLDLGDVPVAVSATDSMRAAAVFEQLRRMPQSDAEPVASLRFGGTVVPLPEREPDEWQADLRLWFDDEALTLAYRRSISGVVRSGRGSVGGYASDLSVAFRQIAPFMLASLLAPHDRFLLHGGAIAREGEAILVLGDSGVGKSTLILGALRNGWSVLSDDLVLVRPSPDGPTVTGIPKSLAVPGEALEEEPSDSTDGDSRVRVVLPFEDWDRDWRPIGAVVGVAHGQREQSYTEPIERHLLLGLLTRSMLAKQPALVRRYLPTAIALCDLPSCRLRHSLAPAGRADEAVRAMAAHLRVDAGWCC